MKRTLSYITACLVAAVSFAGCIETDYPTQSEGRLVLNVGFDETGADGHTRAAAPTDYTVKIGTSESFTHVFSQDEVPDELWLPSRSGYVIEVTAGAPQDPSWESGICYYGRQEFAITDGDVAYVTVNAAPRNTFFAVTFDDTVEEWLSDYSLTIYPDPEDETKTLVFDADNAGEATANITLADGQTEMDWLFEATNADSEEAVEKEGTFAGLLPGKAYSVSFKYTYVEREGSFTLTVDVDETTDDHGHLIIIPKNPLPVDMTEIAPHEVWATHTAVGCELSADYEGAGVVRFAYRATGSEEWTYVAGVEGSEGDFSADLTGLAPGTEYETGVELDGELIGDPQTFTTEAAPQMPNWKLEEWHENNVYYPYLSDATPFWGSGNVRAMGIINVEMTTPVAGRTAGSTAAQLQSKVTVGTFGAGNLFTGSFRLSGTTGFVNFGREFTARPSGLKVGYKATTGTVTHAGSGSPIAVGDPDQFQIQIALADSGFPHEINTSDLSTFVDYQTHPGIIAYGEIHGSVDMADWSETVIPLTYRSTERTPTHIIVIASASRYGDYFTGSTSSVMWVDDMELVY